MKSRFGALTPNARQSFFVAAAVHPRVAVANRATPMKMHVYAACLCILSKLSSGL